jgi:isopenicillin-N epimerase
MFSMRNMSAGDWILDPSLIYLDHGSFGACPRPVLSAQSHLRNQMERQPAEFFMGELEPLLDEARAALAQLLNVEARDLAFTSNATTGVNSVLRALEFVANDELLTTDHCYTACKNTLNYIAEQTGAKVVTAQVPFPLDLPSQVVDCVLAATTTRTRIALLDHVTSPTALIFPVRELVEALTTRGVDVLVDGAHTPGMIPLDIPALGAAYYVGTCHKWLCAPKGSAFLWVRRDKQTGVHPTAISHGFASLRQDRPRFLMEFDWTGTDDPTPYLCVPDSLGFLSSVRPGGLPELMSLNREMALAARDEVCKALAARPPAPGEMIGAMAAVPIREARDEEYGDDFTTDPLHKVLLARYRINVLVTAWPKWPKRVMRLSAQVYNEPEHFRQLAHALRELKMTNGGEDGG